MKENASLRLGGKSGFYAKGIGSFPRSNAVIKDRCELLTPGMQREASLLSVGDLKVTVYNNLKEVCRNCRKCSN